MNLAEYEKLEASASRDYLRFQENGETHYLRFLYTSGGETMGDDIQVRRKKWDEEANKFVYDTPDGQLIANLKCIEYDADGKNPRIVIWERSAYFCKNTLLPMWRNYPRIIDGVWKVTASNPKTIDASYSLFPVMNADSTTYPIIEDTVREPEATADVTEAAPEEPKPEATPKKKKYWEED